MNNLKAKHILGWMIFCMIMPIIPVVSYFVFLDHVDMRDGGLILIFPGLAVLLAIPLSLLNLFLFKKNLSTSAAKRIASTPPWAQHCLLRDTFRYNDSIYFGQQFRRHLHAGIHHRHLSCYCIQGDFMVQE